MTHGVSELPERAESAEGERLEHASAVPSEELCKTIPVSELRVGMQVVDPSVDWVKRPYLYGGEVFIDSEDTIRRIVGEGYLEVTIDLARSSDVLFVKGMHENPAFARSDRGTPPQPAVALEEELPRATRVHESCVAYARRFMSDMSAGKMNLSAAAAVVEDIMHSLERNEDALISLSRLRRTDAYTYRHCVNVSILSACFTRYLGKDSDAVFAAGVGGLFHDLGKALVPLRILNAPRKLTEVEFGVLRRHPVLGYEQLSKVPGVMPEVLQGMMEHHEKFDGSGYPNGLAGESISPVGGITAVADVYDALTSRRVYKGAMYPHKALGVMYQSRNREFAAENIEQFIRMVGIYPVGSVVALEDGHIAVVCASNSERPLQPSVALVRRPDGVPLPSWQVRDIAAGECASIVACMPAEKFGIDPARVLGIGGI